LLAAAGKQDKDVAADLGATAQKAARWRKRFLALGMAGLEKDAPRLGIPAKPNAKSGMIPNTIGA
jgi:hypothetical protein